MGAFSNFISFLRSGSGSTYTLERAITEETTASAEAELDLKLLTMASALNYLAAGLALCDWRVFRRGREVHDKLYYQLNNQPNPNQNKSAFCAKLVGQMFFTDEVVIFSPRNGLPMYIADHFQKVPHGTLPDQYLDVCIDDDDGRSYTFSARDVASVRLGCANLWPLLSEAAESYAAMIQTAYTSYAKQAGERGVLTIGAAESGTTEQREAAMQRTVKRFQQYFSSHNAVIPLYSGYSYAPNATAHRNTSEINDVINLSDEWAERVGLATMVPVTLLKGSAENTEHAMNDLVLGLRRIIEPLEESFNAAYFGMSGMERGDRIMIDPTRVLLGNLETLGKYCEDMIQTGQMNQDELRQLRREPLVGGPASKAYFMTLNYGSLENAALLEPGKASETKEG